MKDHRGLPVLTIHVTRSDNADGGNACSSTGGEPPTLTLVALTARGRDQRPGVTKGRTT